MSFLTLKNNHIITVDRVRFRTKNFSFFEESLCGIKKIL